MTIVYTLCLPRDRSTVPVLRRLFRSSMERLGVESECVDDMELAVTEACTNVLLHADDSADEYEVSVQVNEKQCEINVIDKGQGFDHTSLTSAASTSETGRGIQLMKALVDSVSFVSKPQDGTIVHLVKQLALTEDSALRTMAAGAG